MLQWSEEESCPIQSLLWFRNNTSLENNMKYNETSECRKLARIRIKKFDGTIQKTTLISIKVENTIFPS